MKHRDLVDKFLEIAERRVCIVDEYGDENWDVLPEEIYRCLAKVAKREPIDLFRWNQKNLAEEFSRRNVKRLEKLVGTYQ